ncbi:MAG: cation:proton antiporter [Luteolibacter sp.]|uniref:cation:proton antiporter domain-containing protein n=1 Tax=Luteolibacter sp. TaxID=1962973 RepID=UPI0032678150
MAFEQAFQQAFIYLAAAIVAVLLGKQIRLGAVLGYLIIGAAIGPWGLHLMGNEGEQITHFAEFGVVVMLFLIGLELRPTMLWKMRHHLLGLGSLQVGLCALGVAGLACAFGVQFKPAIAIGLILAMSSTAIVLQTLAEKGLLHTEAGQNSFAVLLFQDIAVIPIIALMPLLGNGGRALNNHGASNAWMAHWPGWAQALTTIGAVALIVAVAQIGMRRMFQAIARTHQREAFTGAALLLVIGVALLMTKVGLSPALGAFIAGVVLASSEFRHELESDLDPFKGILLGLFFLGVGAGIDFGYIRDHLGLVIGGALGLIVVKGGILYGLSMLKERRTNSALLFAASLAAGGEFAFVLITLSLSSGVFSVATGRAVVVIVALSMATTPLLILAAQHIISRVPESSKPEPESDATDEGNPVIICGFGRFGHAIGRLLRSRGFDCTVLDHDTDQVELLRSLGVPIFYGDASRPELLTIAGAARAKILVIALKDADTTLKIVKNARRHHPHLKIFVRAYSRIEAYEYLNAGEDLIYRDTLDSSIRLGIDVLKMLGESDEAADRASRLYRERDEVMVREMAKHRIDSKEFFTAAKEAHRSLNELMRSDIATGQATSTQGTNSAGAQEQ